MECATCAADARAEPVPRWKAPLLFVGALLFCPCHLPATFAVLTAAGAGLGGAAWLLDNKIPVYLAFSLLYVLFLALFIRWAFSARDRERRLEELHAVHAGAG